MRVILVRHGEVKRTGKIAELRDEPLTANGRDEAEKTAAFIRQAYPRVTAVVHSEYARCVATAETIAGNLGVPIWSDARLNEQRTGIYEGAMITDLPPDLIAAMEARGAHPSFIAGEESDEVDALEEQIARLFQEGETARELKARGTSALKHIMDNRQDDVVIVTHNGVINAIVAALSGVAPQCLKPNYNNGKKHCHVSVVNAETMTVEMSLSTYHL